MTIRLAVTASGTNPLGGTYPCDSGQAARATAITPTNPATRIATLTRRILRLPQVGITISAFSGGRERERSDRCGRPSSGRELTGSPYSCVRASSQATDHSRQYWKGGPSVFWSLKARKEVFSACRRGALLGRVAAATVKSGRLFSRRPRQRHRRQARRRRNRRRGRPRPCAPYPPCPSHCRRKAPGGHRSAGQCLRPRTR